MTQKPENHREGVPVSQAILRKRLFLPAIPKNNHFGQNTALSRFSQNTVFLHQKHTILSGYREKIDAIGNKTEN